MWQRMWRITSTAWRALLSTTSAGQFHCTLLPEQNPISHATRTHFTHSIAWADCPVTYNSCKNPYFNRIHCYCSTGVEGEYTWCSYCKTRDSPSWRRTGHNLSEKKKTDNSNPIESMACYLLPVARFCLAGRVYWIHFEIPMTHDGKQRRVMLPFLWILWFNAIMKS